MSKIECRKDGIVYFIVECKSCSTPSGSPKPKKDTTTRFLLPQGNIQKLSDVSELQILVT